MFNIIIKDLRIKKGISQQGLANVLGINQTTISSWELSKVKYSKIRNIIKLAKFFEVSVDYLLGLAND